MNYEVLLRRLRRDPRLFDTEEDHKIHRILLAVKARVIARRRSLPQPVGPYSGLTKQELRQTRTCEPDWF